MSCTFRSVEPVKIVYPDGKVKITPDFATRKTTARASYINSCTGLSVTASDISTLLSRMSLGASAASSDPNEDELLVEVPPTRPDILHECDIMEDAAIAYGFNNLPDKFPATSTVAQPLAISKLGDIVRTEWAMTGWVEVLPLILVRSNRAVAHAALFSDRNTLSALTKRISSGSTTSTTALRL